MTEVGIVGAGAAAGGLSVALREAVPSVSVTVLEKSGGVCGRAATRRRDDVVYDYGANYLKSEDSRVTELVTDRLSTDGLVDVTEPVWTFDADGTVSEGRDADDHKWSYRRGITQLGKRLFGTADATVHRNTRVERIVREEDWWLVDDTDTSWGPFDALAVTPPAPQTAELLADADWGAPLRETLAAGAADVPYRSVWTAVLGYPFRLEVPYYALVNTDKEHAVGWVSREECKSGHVPGGETVLIVQASNDWSVANRDADPAANVAELADAAADIVGDDRLRDPAWTDHQDWRYAQPESELSVSPAATSAGLYLTGDWVAGEGRLHAALRSGLETGTRLAEDL